MSNGLIPATILTGFLGSGKTTLLKRVLTEAHGQKIAVIENEFGEENIDNEILVQAPGEQIIQLNNGCVCCTPVTDNNLGERSRQGLSEHALQCCGWRDCRINHRCRQHSGHQHYQPYLRQNPGHRWLPLWVDPSNKRRRISQIRSSP